MGKELKQTKSIEEIAQQIADLNIKCRYCDNPIKAEDINHYPHIGGIQTKKSIEKVWVYFKCSKCGHAWSVHKLLHQAKTKQMRQTKL